MLSHDATCTQSPLDPPTTNVTCVTFEGVKGSHRGWAHGTMCEGLERCPGFYVEMGKGPIPANTTTTPQHTTTSISMRNGKFIGCHRSPINQTFSVPVFAVFGPENFQNQWRKMNLEPPAAHLGNYRPLETQNGVPCLAKNNPLVMQLHITKRQRIDPQKGACVRFWGARRTVS